MDSVDCYDIEVEFGPADARLRAAELLAESYPRRWAHVCEVARRAALITARLDDGEVLEVASWVHDIGYAAPAAASGFHPLDGARHLRELRVSGRIVDLVAFHSSAGSEAETFGVAEQLAEFKDERSLTRDLLWYLDMTTGPDGHVVTFEDRMSEVRERYPGGHYVIRALDLGMSERVAAVERATDWLSSVGLSHV